MVSSLYKINVSDTSQDLNRGDVVRQQPFHRYLALPERVERSYTTDRPFGKPIQHEAVKATPIVPKATGDERHNGLMDVLQKVLQIYYYTHPF